MKRGGKGGYNPWYSKGAGGNFQNQKDKPIFAVSRNNDEDDDDGSYNVDPPSTADITFSTDREPGSFIGWKLYFPFKSFKDSRDLVRRIEIMERHFSSKDHIHWYDRAEIEETCILHLPLEYILEDENLLSEWPSIVDDITSSTTQSFACIALAMHNVIVKDKSAENSEEFQHQKIFTRPIGFSNPIKLSTANQIIGKLITVVGTVVHEEPISISNKMVCFRCSKCSTELVVRQNPQVKNYVYPSSCHRGCSARGRFVELLTSPFTIYQSKQKITIKESIYDDKQEFKTLEVELVQDFVDSVVLGTVISVSGVVKHGLHKKFLKKNEGKLFKSYLKCFNVETLEGTDKVVEGSDMICDGLGLIQTVKSQESPFRLLVHSLCPTIFGREEVKAGLVLALLSGNNLLKKRRSVSHVLLIGSPGVGKSALLQACAEISTKGIFQSGPTSTAVGLTASVAKNGVMDAGALVLANGGACCIDEFDKMQTHAHILLESMEQEIISITKCGVKVNLPSSVVIIAAANPVGSFYNKAKTLPENVRITSPLLSRFDLIYPLTDQDKSSDAEFFMHISKKPRPSSNQSPAFFSQQRSVSRDKITWLKRNPADDIEIMPADQVRFYIGYARENVFPKLSLGARDEILSFFMKLRELTVGTECQKVTYRQLEGLMRLTLARARADLAEIATKEHAVDVINIFKFTMPDIFADEAFNATSATGEFNTSSIKKSQNLSSLSKPKQQKAFIEHLQDLDQSEFTSGELKDIAKELGIKDFREIIDKLNHVGELLKTANGYRVVE